MKRNAFITGTLWLSGAGLITRLLGFVYRIYLSNLVGSEGMGLYQLLTPVYFLILTLCTTGIQMAVSRMVALQRGASHYHNMARIVFVGLIPSFSLSLFFSFLLFQQADFVALSILGDIRTASGLRILCLSLPFCSLSSCCKAYFHGLQQMTVPAIDQILEQVVRMGAVFLAAPLLNLENLERTCCIVVAATAAGDILASMYVTGAFALSQRKYRSRRVPDSYGSLLRTLILISLPITGGRMVTQILSCFENIMLPSALQRFGCTAAESLSLFGVYSGMVMPILFFPSVLTGSISANLLPMAAQAQASGNIGLIHRCIDRVIRFTFLLAFLCTALLAGLGDRIGTLLYPGTEAGHLLVLLSFFCPFMYLQGTLSGLLNGLGLQNSVFVYQLISNSITVLTVLLFVPRYGFPAFLIGYLVSLMISSVLNLYKLLHTFRQHLRILKSIALPFLSCLAAISVIRMARRLTADAITGSPLPLLLTFLFAALLYSLALFVSGSITKKDLSQVLKLFG